MLKKIEKILELSEKRVNFLHNHDQSWFYKWFKILRIISWEK